MGSGWPHNALRHHWHMPISCHFRDCKALLVTSKWSCKWCYSNCQDLYLYLYFVRQRDENLHRTIVAHLKRPKADLLQRLVRVHLDVLGRLEHIQCRHLITGCFSSLTYNQTTAISMNLNLARVRSFTESKHPLYISLPTWLSGAQHCTAVRPACVAIRPRRSGVI